MKLYVFQIAPIPTKVRLYLAEKTTAGAVIDLPQVTVNLASRSRSSNISKSVIARFGGVEIDPQFLHLAAWDGRYRDRPAAKAVLRVNA